MGDGFKYREIHCNDCSATLTNYSEYIEDDIELCILWNTRADDAPEQTVDSCEVFKFHDTRELLEADIRAEYNGAIAHEADEIIGWLDRQAAITEREFWEGYANGNQWEAHQFETKCNELTAERDELRKKLDEKQRVIDVQRDSFLKLEAENAELRRMLADAAEAI
jgi:hypothetical protein